MSALGQRRTSRLTFRNSNGLAVVVARHSPAQSGEGTSTAELLARATPLHRLQMRCKGGFPGRDEVGLKNVEAQAHRAINDDSFFRVFAPLSIQRDDEHLPLHLWCPTSKPIFDLLIADSPATR
jgi:hypothetical protein